MIIDIYNNGHYTAEEGKVIIPKDIEKDNFYCSESIWLASYDSISNYKEITVEEWEKIKEQFSNN